MYDAAAGGYKQVECSQGADGALTVKPLPLIPDIPHFDAHMADASMKGRRQTQEDRSTTIPDFGPLLAAHGCMQPPVPATFLGVYDGHAGSESADFVAERLHEDVAKQLGPSAPLPPTHTNTPHPMHQRARTSVFFALPTRTVVPTPPCLPAGCSHAVTLPLDSPCHRSDTPAVERGGCRGRNQSCLLTD